MRKFAVLVVFWMLLLTLLALTPETADREIAPSLQEKAVELPPEPLPGAPLDEAILSYQPQITGQKGSPEAEAPWIPPLIEEKPTIDPGRPPAVDPDPYEPDDDPYNATSLSPNNNLQSQNHTLHNGSDNDWYYFYGSTTYTYVFYSTGTINLQAILYNDQANTQLAIDESSGVGGNNFFLYYKPASNGYYRLRVHSFVGNVGSYTLHYSLGAPPDAYENDDTASTFWPLVPQTSLSTQIRTLDSGTDQDWCRFYGYPGRNYVFFSRGGTDTMIELYASNGTTLLAVDDDSGAGLNFDLTFNPPAEAYYLIKIRGFGGAMGFYTLNYVYFVHPDQYEYNNTHNFATNLSFSQTPQTQNHTFHNSNDIDWFRFQAQAGKIYRIETTGYLDTVAQLFMDDGTTLLAVDDDSGDGLNFSLNYLVTTTGSYKLKVYAYSGAIGAYQLNYFYGQDPDDYEPDDSSWQTTLITPEYPPEIQSHTLHSGDDEDWFSFDAIAGETYVFYSTGNTDVRAYLYENDGTTFLAADDDGAGYPNFRLEYTPTSSRPLKLVIDGYANAVGAYDLIFYRAIQPDGYEPNNNFTEATILYMETAIQSQNHNIHYHADEDWFKFYATAGYVYTIYSSGNLNMMSIIYDSDGTTTINWNDDSGEGMNFLLQHQAVTTGWRYLKVHSWNSQVGPYSIHYSHAPSGLAAPTQIYYTLIGESLELSWFPVLNATSYRVEASDDPYTGFIPVATVTTNFWVTQASSARKFYRVRALN